MTWASIPRARSQRASQKPSRPASKAIAIRSILCPAFSASSRQRLSSFSNALSSTASFFNGERSTPGTIPATSQLDWPISITAISVASCSRTTRDLLKSFCCGMGRSIDSLERRWCHCPRRSPHSIFLRRLGALTVDDCRARACLAARLLAHRHIKRIVAALQRAVPIPQLEIMVHRALRRQILGQRLPLAAGPQQVEKAVDDLAHVDIPRPPATSCRWDHRRHQGPFFIGEITRITQILTSCRSTMFRCPHRSLSAPVNQHLPGNHNRLIRLNKFLDRLSDLFHPSVFLFHWIASFLQILMAEMEGFRHPTDFDLCFLE